MKSKESKKNYIEEMKKNFSSNESVMIAQYQGLNVNELDELRKNLREKGILFKIINFTNCMICRNPFIFSTFHNNLYNSYYIENGEIKYPVIETMISGNISNMFLNINNISNENINFGDRILPWISFNGITISWYILKNYFYF